jgi:hypothetical protein
VFGVYTWRAPIGTVGGSARRPPISQSEGQHGQRSSSRASRTCMLFHHLRRPSSSSLSSRACRRGCRPAQPTPALAHCKLGVRLAGTHIAHNQQSPGQQPCKASAMSYHLRDASSLVQSQCSTSYHVPRVARPVRRRSVAPARAAAKEVRGRAERLTARLPPPRACACRALCCPCLLLLPAERGAAQAQPQVQPQGLETHQAGGAQHR